METLANKHKISETFEQVRRFSFEEKKESAFDEVRINKLLDTILEFKKAFNDKTNKISALVQEIEQITWYNNPDNESLMSINDLISSIRDLHSSFFRQYICLNAILEKRIATAEIMKFKDSIDDLKDVASDLESRFFFLPKIENFQETSKELSLL
jgi:hypothetical protein